MVKLIKSVEQLNMYINTEPNAHCIVGYARGAVERLLKQLKGEYPIL